MTATPKRPKLTVVKGKPVALDAVREAAAKALEDKARAWVQSCVGDEHADITPLIADRALLAAAVYHVSVDLWAARQTARVLCNHAADLGLDGELQMLIFSVLQHATAGQLLADELEAGLDWST